MYVFVLFSLWQIQWPTVCRSTILSACAMVGRIGSMAAPMTIILVVIKWHIVLLIYFSFTKFPIFPPLPANHLSTITNIFIRWNFDYRRIISIFQSRNIFQEASRNFGRSETFVVSDVRRMCLTAPKISRNQILTNGLKPFIYVYCSTVINLIFQELNNIKRNP